MGKQKLFFQVLRTKRFFKVYFLDYFKKTLFILTKRCKLINFSNVVLIYNNIQMFTTNSLRFYMIYIYVRSKNVLTNSFDFKYLKSKLLGRLCHTYLNCRRQHITIYSIHIITKTNRRILKIIHFI